MTSSKTTTSSQIIFVVLILFFTVGTLIFSFLTWRTITVQEKNNILDSNHEQHVNVATSYVKNIEEFQKKESRLPDSQFKELENQTQETFSLIESTKTNLSQDSFPVLAEQEELIIDGLESMKTTLNSIKKYGEFIDCSSEVLRKLQSNEQDVTTVQLIITVNGIESFNKEGVEQIAQYLESQSLNAKGYTECGNVISEQPIINEQGKLLDDIATYNQLLENMIDDVRQIITLAYQEKFEEANVINQNLLTTQMELFELSLETKIFIPSQIIQENIKSTNDKVEQYNNWHSKLQ